MAQLRMAAGVGSLRCGRAGRKHSAVPYRRQNARLQPVWIFATAVQCSTPQSASRVGSSQSKRTRCARTGQRPDNQKPRIGHISYTKHTIYIQEMGSAQLNAGMTLLSS